MVAINVGGSLSPSRVSATSSGRWMTGPNPYASVWVPGGASAANTSQARVPTSALPRSPDAASVWAGGYAETRSKVESASMDAARQAALARLSALGPGSAFIGVDVTQPGWNPVYIGGYDPKAAVVGKGNYFQGPEYTVGQEWTVGQRFTASELAEWRATITRLGLVDERDIFGPTWGTTDARVMAALMQEANVTAAADWRQVLSGWEQTGGNPGNIYGPGGAGAEEEGPTTTTTRIYQKTGLDTGRSILRDLMRQELGRAPTDAEVRRYIGALNRMETSTPEIVERTDDAAGNITQRVLQTAPDVEETLYGQVEAGNQGEIGEYRAGQFMSILERLA